MNNDLISREALRKDIEHLHSVYVDNKDWFYTDVLNHIDNAPAVLHKGHGDLIDRDVARNILNDLSFNCGELLRYVSTVIPADKNDNDEIIDDAPTVEQRPQGKWIVIFDEDNVKTCKCSICGRMEDIVDFDKYPYCHCGAKMKYDTKQ